MKKGKQNVLYYAIKELPKNKVPDMVWGRIEDELLNNSLQKTINELPTFAAPKKIWNDIDNNLVPALKNKIRFYSNTYVRIAASILLIIGIGFLFYNNMKQSDYKLTYSIEKNYDEIIFNPVSESINTNYIAGNCQKLPEICETPVFKELNSQLSELITEKDKLEKIMENNPDPQLMKFYYKLENKKVSIEKEIIKLFVES